MAHSLFEPEPEPLSHKLLRQFRSFNPAPSATLQRPVNRRRPGSLDARSQQLMLEEAFESDK